MTTYSRDFGPASLSEKGIIMKTAGIVIIVVGLVMSLYSGFTFITKEKVVDLGPLEITRDKHNTINWQPYFGFGIMALGGVVLVFARKKSPAI